MNYRSDLEEVPFYFSLDRSFVTLTILSESTWQRVNNSLICSLVYNTLSAGGSVELVDVDIIDEVRLFELVVVVVVVVLQLRLLLLLIISGVS